MGGSWYWNTVYTLATIGSKNSLLAHSQLGLEDAYSIRQSESAIPTIQSLSMSCSLKISCASGEPWTSSARGQTATAPTRSRQIPFAAPHRIAMGPTREQAAAQSVACDADNCVTP